MKFSLSALLALTLLASCQTTHSFRQPSAAWQTYQGQLRYSDASRTLIGEVVVASLPPDEFQLDYVAGPGFPLLRLRSDATSARAEGVLARGRWQGKPGAVPARFGSLFALSDVFHRLTARSGAMRSSTPGLWEAKASAQNGRVTALDVRFPTSGERFQFVFSPKS